MKYSTGISNGIVLRIVVSVLVSTLSPNEQTVTISFTVAGV